MLYPVSIKGVLLNQENKIVLLRNERNEWELPGGRLEPHETPQACLVRECFEELNIQVHVHRLLDTWLFEVIPGKYVFVVTYACQADSFESLRLSHEHKEVGSFALEKLRELNMPQGYKRAINLYIEDLKQV